VDRHFDRAPLPEQVVPFYDEVLTFKAKSGPRAADGAVRKTPLRLDLHSLIGKSKVDRAVIVPFDDDSWYEPTSLKLSGTSATLDFDLDKDFLVALDLGETARHNYQAITQLGAAGGLIPGGMKPRLCQLILCAPERFSLFEISKRMPEVDGLPFEIGNVLPPVDVGPVGRTGSICDKCFERQPNLLPCFLWKWCTDFPIKRKIHVRKNIYTLTSTEIATLRTGVAAMKARPPSDPTSWWYQARMHAIDSGTAAALQDNCQHRQFFFFSWHRMFVYYFERILRKASGDPNFAQPYWNYTDIPAEGVIPEPYRLPADEATNALYNASRAPLYNGGAALPPADVSYASGFDLTNFTTTLGGVPSFGGRTVSVPMHLPSPAPGSGLIERSPHNNVHNDIGGMTGDMAGGESPRDPVFWLHHSNIDRLWKRWIALGNGRANPTTDTVWMTQVFSFFDENGAQVDKTGAEILNTATQLAYRYDDDPYVWWPLLKDTVAIPAERRFFPPEVLATAKRPVRLGDKRVDAPIALPEKGRSELKESQAADLAKDRLILQLKDIQFDAPVGVTYLLFLNLPADARNPDHTHPSFIGTLGFFGAGKHGTHGADASQGLAEEYDVTRVARRLNATGDLVLTAIPSLPVIPEGRKDLQALVDRLKPHGNPRFGEIVLLRVKAE
jgi:tyrosinase